jgi:hypothetical protein
MTFEVRTVGESAATIAGIRRAVAGIDRMLPLTGVKTQDAQIDDSLAEERIIRVACETVQLHRTRSGVCRPVWIGVV